VLWCDEATLEWPAYLLGRLELSCSDGIARNQSAYDGNLTLRVTTGASGGSFSGQDHGSPASNYTFNVHRGCSPELPARGSSAC
jgi:hypothetical protein